ncbi:MAG: hypothetical protein KAH32_02615 [Chlamydiia bacterium]|nr:hypothetical protein [Chlamydiia bacterium]
MIYYLLSCCLAAFGAYHVYSHPTESYAFILDGAKKASQTISTKSNYNVLLLGASEGASSEATSAAFTAYYPHLLVYVRHFDANKTPHDLVQIWDMSDCEIVLNTETWQKTHGIEDLNASCRQENAYRIAEALSRAGKATTKELSDSTGIPTQKIYQAMSSDKNSRVFINNKNIMSMSIPHSSLPEVPHTISRSNKSFNTAQTTISSSNLRAKEYTQKDIIRLFSYKIFGDRILYLKSKLVYIPKTTFVTRSDSRGEKRIYSSVGSA